MKKYLDEEGLRVLADNIGGGTDGKVPPHQHTSEDIADPQKLRNRIGLGDTLGAVPVANGGTGETTINNVRKALFPSPSNVKAPTPYALPYFGASSYEASYLTMKELRNAIGLGNSTDVLAIGDGGTGARTAEEALKKLGAAGEPKKLWEGANWITGTINIPGVSEYKALYFEMYTDFAQGFGVMMTKIESSKLFAADITTQPIKGQTSMNLERAVVICRYDTDSLIASTNLLRYYRLTPSLTINFTSSSYGCQRIWGLF